MKLKSTLISAIALTGAVAAWPAMSDTFKSDVPGSYLVYPVFDDTLETYASGTQNKNSTTIRLTNTDDTGDVWVKFISICGDNKSADIDPQGLGRFDQGHPGAQSWDCPANDKTLKFSPRETKVLSVGLQNADLITQCSEGYIVAYAVNGKQDGRPIKWNKLHGSYLIKSTVPTRGMADQAISIQAVGRDGEDSMVTKGSVIPDYQDGLDFNGREYENMAYNLYTDFRSIQFNPTLETDLVMLTLDIDAGLQNPATSVFIEYWSKGEDTFSTTWKFFCWDRRRLDRMSLGFRESNLQASGGVNNDPTNGEHGSMEITPTNQGAVPNDWTILGAIIEKNGPYSSVRNLYHDYTPRSTVFYPNAPF